MGRWVVGGLVVLTTIMVVVAQVHFWFGSEKSIRERFTFNQKVAEYGREYRLKTAGREWYAKEEKIKKVLDKIEVGDRLELEGKKDESGRVEIEGVWWRRLKPNEWWCWGYWLRLFARIRSDLDNIYRSVFGEPMASLISGIVLGGKGQFSPELYEALIRTGTLHIVAASGFNVTLVIGVVVAITSRIWGRRRAAIISFGAVVAYVMLAGGGPAIVRAGIMGVLAVGAQVTGKRYLAGWGLIVTTALMLIDQPGLIKEVSFQLSISATAGLVWGSHKIKKIFDRWLKQRGGKLGYCVAASLSTTLAAITATLPISLIAFGEISLVSPIINLLVLGLVAPIMMIGAGGVVVALISYSMGSLILWLAWPLLKIMIEAVLLMAKPEWSLWHIGKVSWWFGLGWWLLLIVWWSKKDEN